MSPTLSNLADIPRLFEAVSRSHSLTLSAILCATVGKKTSLKKQDRALKLGFAILKMANFRIGSELEGRVSSTGDSTTGGSTVSGEEEDLRGMADGFLLAPDKVFVEDIEDMDAFF